MSEDDLSRGIIVNSGNRSPTIRSDRDGQIEYPNGHALVWHKDEDGDGSIFDYHTNSIVDPSKSVRLRLNDLIKYGEWVFVPVESGFAARVRESGIVKPYPEIQICIPVLRGSELEILAALHEIGHADFYNQSHRSVRESQMLGLNGTYGEQLTEVDGLLSRLLGTEYQEISEVLAWKKALLYDSRFFILHHFTEVEKAAYIRSRLGTYLTVAKTIWTV